MAAQHARLGPSGAQRWSTCPGSVLLTELLPNDSSVYALEGTAAHALGELKASLALGKMSQGEFDQRRQAWAEEWAQFADVFEEMEHHTDAYVDLIFERKARYPHSQVFLEQRVETGVPECWGTADVVIVSPFHVEAIDLKYGRNLVGVVGNPQLRLYGVGALEKFGDMLGTTETVFYTIFQPRLMSTLTESMPAADLREWRDSLIPIAEIALKPGAPFGPSVENCHYCPASGQCKAQMESVFANDLDTKAEVLTPSEIADALGQVDHIREWCDAVEKVAFKKADDTPNSVPGWKIIKPPGNRFVKDPAKAIRVLKTAGYEEDDYMKPPGERTIQGIGALEALVGKVSFKALLEDTGIVTKGEGKKKLVPADHKSPAYDKNSEAAQVFAKVQEEGLL